MAKLIIVNELGTPQVRYTDLPSGTIDAQDLTEIREHSQVADHTQEAWENEVRRLTEFQYGYDAETAKLVVAEICHSA